MSYGRANDGAPIFVDASAWLAVMNRRDQHHAVARALFDALIESERLVTTTWTAYEALSMVKSRVGWEAADELWTLLTGHEAVEFYYVSKEIEERALELFLGFHDKTWGVVDCANLIVMQDLGCRQAFGFDHHFIEASRQQGFELISVER